MHPMSSECQGCCIQLFHCCRGGVAYLQLVRLIAQTAQTRQSYKQMLRSQNNLCARLGSFTSLQNREELSYAPDVCFMTQWPRLILWWVSANVTDRGKPFADPLCRAGHSPSTCIISLSSNCFCQFSVTSAHRIRLQQQLCPHHSLLSSTSVLFTESGCKHICGANNKTAQLQKYHKPEGQRVWARWSVASYRSYTADTKRKRCHFRAVCTLTRSYPLLGIFTFPKFN